VRVRIGHGKHWNNSSETELGAAKLNWEVHGFSRAAQLLENDDGLHPESR
jgi:hypothetical protein